jgi:hypothetical protein
MAKIENLQSPVAAAIEKKYEAAQVQADSPVLRCSKIGEECDAALWFEYRWTTPLARHSGRQERLFETGRLAEARLVQDLRDIGCFVQEVDPDTGKQWRVSFLNGVMAGSADGIVTGVPGAEKTTHLLEIKTMNDKSFQDWRRRGTEQSKPTYYAQVQIYMHGLGLDRALLLAVNKNNDEVEAERIKYDPAVAEAIVERAKRIAYSAHVPAKTESFACKWCKHEKVCRYDDWSRAHCRTCLFSELTDAGEWRCNHHGGTIPVEYQAKGCDKHLFIPDLVPGEQIDADETAHTVTYKLRTPLGDSDIYVDGAETKIIVSEAAE